VCCGGGGGGGGDGGVVRLVCLCARAARSSLLDRGFDMCEFRDDPAPLRDTIRSRRMKILLRECRTLSPMRVQTN